MSATVALGAARARPLGGVPLAAALLGAAATATYGWQTPLAGALATVADIAALAALLAAASLAASGRRTGFALNGVNRYSLARLQMAAWTVAIGGTLLAAAEWNLCAAPLDSTPGPFDITIPGPLLAALGIAVTSAAAAPVILSVKADLSPPATGAQLSAAAPAGPGTLVPRNQVLAYASPASASWRDLVTGDDLALANRIDLSKVQQGLFTALLLAGYLAAVLVGFRTGQRITTLPEGSSTLAGLLGISHAGYLAYKAIPKLDSTPQPDPAPSL